MQSYLENKSIKFISFHCKLCYKNDTLSTLYKLCCLGFDNR